MNQDDPFWDDLFHGCAFEAFVAEAKAVQGWPDPERTKQRAYAMFDADKRAVDTSPKPR